MRGETGDVHPTKLYLLQESSAKQGEVVAKEELEGGVDGGEETRTCFSQPDSKRQGSCNSFAFIVTGSSGKLKEAAHYSRCHGIQQYKSLLLHVT